MIALFRLLPLVWKLSIVVGVIVAIVGTGWAIHHHIWKQGYQAALADVAHDNQEAVDAVDKNRVRVIACNNTDGMRWSQSARECVRRD